MKINVNMPTCVHVRACVRAFVHARVCACIHAFVGVQSHYGCKSLVAKQFFSAKIPLLN